MMPTTEPDWTMRDGLPEAVWAAARLGDQSTYALLVDLRPHNEMRFWICEAFEAEPYEENDIMPAWRAIRMIATADSKKDGSATGFLAPECWTTAGREKVTLLTYPCDEWSGYTVEGLPDAP